MTRLKTLSPDNQFRFTCPVFGAEVRLAECVSLRDTYAIGKRPEQRRGCQACLSASKCPMVRMLQVVQRTGEDPGLYSAEPKVGSLPADMLNHIAPIVVSEHLLDHYGVPLTEREIILANNARTVAGKAKAKPEAIALESLPQEERETQPRTKAETKPDAATTGDMGAAITKAMQRAAQAPESPAKADPASKPAVVASAAPTPPLATPAAPKPKPAVQAKPSDLAKSPGKPLSLLEIARQRRAASAA